MAVQPAPAAAAFRDVVSANVGILTRAQCSYRVPAMTGCLRFYDQPTRWGVIVADDGGLYMILGQHVAGPPLREGERVRFDGAAGPGGLRATAVQRLTPFAKGPTNAAR